MTTCAISSTYLRQMNSTKIVNQSELWRRTNHYVSRTVSFPTQLIFKLKTHLAAGNRESKSTDLMTTRSRRKKPFPGVFQTCVVSKSIASIENSRTA